MQVNPLLLGRIVAALEFREPDRVPIWESLQHQAVYDHCAPGAPFPECAAIACEMLGIDATYGCMEAVTEERREGSRIHTAQTIWETEPVFRTLDDLREYRPGKVNESDLEERVLAHHSQMQELYGPNVLYLPQDGGFGFLPGYDAQTLSVIAVALHEDLPALERFWDACAEHAAIHNSITAKHRLTPVVQCCEDIAYKNGLMVSPEVLREHFFPRFALATAPLKAAGIKVILHSDGNIMPVLDDIVAWGLDGINPVDPSAGMDMAEIKQRYAGRLILVGNVGAGHVLEFGTPEQVREDVRRCLREAAPGGGHILQCGDGQVMPDIPLPNLLAYLEEARESGRYPIGREGA